MAKQSSTPRYLFLTGRFCLLALAAAGLGAAAGLTVLFWRQDQTLWAIAALAAGLGWAAVLCSLAAIISLLDKIVEHNQAEVGAWHITHDGLRRQEAILQQMSESILISDGTKEVVSRNRDRELMKNAIQEDITNKDWEAAYQLLEQMQSRFGYSKEAAEFRRLVDAQRAQAVKAVVEETREQIEVLCTEFNWSEAQGLLDSLVKQFPGNSEVKEMAEGLVSQKRAEHKKQLLASWNQAVQNDEVDRGIELLRQMDEYLTPSEAAALEESARGVFRAKLQNLGVAFSVAVTEKKWPEALRVGQEIMQEFPNSRMAEEVRGKVEILRQRAKQEASV